MIEQDCPDLLSDRLNLFQQYFKAIQHPLIPAVKKLLVISDYARRHVPILLEILNTDSGASSLTFEDYQHALTTQFTKSTNSDFARLLRKFRHYHLLRLLLREIAGLASTTTTLHDWSLCADALILQALACAQSELADRYGTADAKLYVLAMGKLGGKELNFSSDIDVIMVFSNDGNTNGKEALNYHQYYTKVVQRFIHLLQDQTEDGFVFRVDLRLRPNGDSGALVSSLAAIETYYQEQGRDWERYAMVKARVIGNNPSWFESLITPFVYRRYVDFSVIESLRSMKSMIEREIQLNPRLNDIKRGLGGIREIEFIVQNIQLVRGGRMPQLRTQNLLKVLMVIQTEQLLQHTTVLKKSYLFLRKLENFLQTANDQQTHELPTDPKKQAQIAYAMECESWDSLNDKLQQYQRIISSLFRALLKSGEGEDNNQLLNHQLATLWQGHIETNMAINLLQSIGYQQADRCYQLIHNFRHSAKCRRLNQNVRLRLDRFMALLLLELATMKDAEAILLQVIHLLENILGRSAYLALLTENPPALKELLYWFANSSFIGALLVNYPFLLEIFLEQQNAWHPPSKKHLALQLAQRLSFCDEMELKEEALRQFKLMNWVLAARAELAGEVDAVRIGRFLANVAEVIVEQVVAIACDQLAHKYPQINDTKNKFMLVAYGKLGSREMNYNSDLDLVFIHTTKDESLVTRLTQKIVHMLMTPSAFGILYAVDTRLRPSGEAGLLVSSLSAFVDYQQQQAWTWEHQALIRARVIVGSKYYRQAFQSLKKAIYLLPRDGLQISQDVISMRAKMGYKPDSIKLANGGLVDLEFLVQYWVLTNPSASLACYTHTLSLLYRLMLNHVVTADDYESLKKAWIGFHEALHFRLLQPEKIIDCQQLQACVSELFQHINHNHHCP